MPVMKTSSPWPSVVFAGDDGVSVPLIGLARFGAAGSVSGTAGLASGCSSVFRSRRGRLSEVASGGGPSGSRVWSGSPICSSSTIAWSSDGLLTRAFLLGLALALQIN